MLTFREYLNYSEKYLMIAEEEYENNNCIDWLLIPSLILAWCSIESFVNNILDDFSSVPDDMFEIHERALLLEKRVKFIDHGDNIGKFALEGSEYRKIEDKILFLIAKFSKQTTRIKGESLWNEFQEFKAARDNLLHPRRDKDVMLSIELTSKYINTAKKIIEELSSQVWGKKVDL
jgi:hypothetical protein